jgi:LCP family protein required for cell wall assembly
MKTATDTLIYKNLANRSLLLDEVPVARPHQVRQWLKRAVLLLMAAVLLGGGFIGWKLYANAAKLAGTNNPFKLFSTFTPSPLNETNGRVNILLAGYSADDPGHQGADLTDSIMILSVNPTTKSAVVISVPRDLYVNIPGYGYSKINAAYEDGQAEHFSASGYATGGMGLLEETLTQDFGISFNYEALINYTAFKDAVNAVGGVTVAIKSSDPRGLYDPYANLNLPNGTVTLNGQQALNLARARGDGYGSYGFTAGDFDRTAHQQQILLALKDKASSAGVISNPLKIGQLADAVGNNVQTDLSIGQMETLYEDTKGISDANIKTVTLNNYNGHDLLAGYLTADGQDALIPAAGLDDYSQIQSVVQSLAGSSPAISSSSSL